MGVVPEMIPLIRALGGKGSCGACPVKINVKREEDSKKTDEAGKAQETAAENAEKNVEEETPETAAKQGETEMDTTVQEDKNDTTVQGDNMDIQYKQTQLSQSLFCGYIVR